jgi:hypothetical protein
MVDATAGCLSILVECDAGQHRIAIQTFPKKEKQKKKEVGQPFFLIVMRTEKKCSRAALQSTLPNWSR